MLLQSRALDAASGEVIWEIEIPEFAIWQPALDGALFVPVGTLLLALDPASGAERWRAEQPTQFGALAVADGVVYVGVNEGGLHALDAASGAVRWVTEVSTGDWSAPAITADLVVAGTTDNTILAFDRATGQQRWSFALDDTGFTDPGITGDLVLASEGNHLNQEGERRLRAIELATGVERWSFTAAGRLLVSPAAGDGAVYIITVTGMLYALGEDRSARSVSVCRGDIARSGVTSDPPIGSPPGVRWQRSFGQDTGAPVVADGVLYIGAESGGLFALDALTGVERWRFETADWVLADPVLGDDVLYIGIGSHLEESGARPVYAIDATTGAELWRFETSGLIIEGLTIANGLLYVVTTGGELYALG